MDTYIVCFWTKEKAWVEAWSGEDYQDALYELAEIRKTYDYVKLECQTNPVKEE